MISSQMDARDKKNSILPTMVLSFMERSVSINSFTIHFFETNHGQSEGDSMHSTIERAMNQVSEIMVPSQLAPILRMARKEPGPYNVVPIQASDISDWKGLSQKQGILRVRISQDLKDIDWTKFMQIQIQKCQLNHIGFKYSHTDSSFSIIKVDHQR